jgi:glycosyltransferase involved in cell wall biosynthesis
MRVLIATGLYPPESGGPATHTRLMEERLPAKGIEVVVLPFAQVRHLPKVLRHLAYFFKCLRRGWGTDIIFAQDTVSVGLPALLAALLSRKKFVVRVPGDYAWEQGSQRFGAVVPIEEFQQRSFGLAVGLLRAAQHFVVRQAHRVVAPSRYLERLILDWGADPKRVSLIYNGVELPVPTEAPAQRPQGFLVVSVGRRVPWKGFEALERVVAREPGWSVKIVSNTTREQALGWVKAADAFVLNSTYEGLSHLLIEAMSLGVPIVATRVGGNPELISDDEEGLLIPAQDEEALYRALKQIEEDPQAARARADAAARKAEQFSIERTARELVRLLNTVCKSS